MKAVILLSILAVAFATECGENEHFESCGTACPLTCENYQNPPKACVLSCNIGCHCDEGYVRSADGRCIKPEECPAAAFSQECGENEHFESCGTACPLTCDNYQNPPKFCVLSCNFGCHCDKGYVRSADGRCVRPEECPAAAFPKMCGENERFETCGTPCPLTCENYQNPPKACVKRCDIGCHCLEGYVRAADGRCVKPEKCPASAPLPVCGENQRYLECGTACPLTCDNYNNPPKICVAMCVAGCHCEPGYVKTRDGRCVRAENCPSKSNAALELCQLPSKTGFCKGYFPRYFFNQETGECEKFIYGGCGGNQNNFKTLEECHNTCVSS